MKNSNINIYNFAKKIAVKIVKLCNWLDQKSGARRTLSNQLIRSGTSVGANLFEGKYAESNADFVHKLRISRKELAETIFWLELLADSEIIERKKIESLHEDAERIGRILTSIIKKKIAQ